MQTWNARDHEAWGIPWGVPDLWLKAWRKLLLVEQPLDGRVMNLAPDVLLTAAIVASPMGFVLEFLLMVVAIALFILAISLTVTGLARRGGASGGGAYGCSGLIFAIGAVLTLAVAIIHFGVQNPALMTLYIAILTALAGILKWTAGNARESLQKRARLLIIELLSKKKMDRAEIRKEIHDNHIIFRMNMNVYIDALDDLQKEGRIVIAGGKYMIRKSESESETRAGLDSPPPES
jgi:hypothetical protein